MKDILKKYLHNPYDREEFKNNILDPIFKKSNQNIEYSKYEHENIENARKTARAIAKSIKKYGTAETSDHVTIHLYEVIVNENIQLERNRVSIGNAIRHLMLNEEAAIITFIGEESNDDWRLSFISKCSKTSDEGFREDYETAPKRYTYFLGKNESCTTASDRLFSLAQKPSLTIQNIEEAFEVEKLSNEFFDKYVSHYKKFCDAITKSNMKTSVFKDNEKAIRDFVKKMLGRIVFLYFLQKKGWLGVPEDKKWGAGNQNFMYKFFEKSGKLDNFYPLFLSPLFFDTLNKERKEDICEIEKINFERVPFLNGGLFERELTEKQNEGIVIKPELFHDLFEFFNQYNFTIYEDDPNDHTVAIDPEMLGHIFENLLEDNKDKGAFYTPKPIVHYMCQESLIEYLCTELPIEKEINGEETIEYKAIDELVKNKIVPNEKFKHLDKIEKALDKVKICDPAIGSGAFPMGLLKEIVSIKQELHTGDDKFKAYNAKLHCIQKSIYGVDIEKGAVDIARLRFWLSLVIDNDNDKPEPLPNLDYKIVVGNSLVSMYKDEVIDIDWELVGIEKDLFGHEIKESIIKILKVGSKNIKSYIYSFRIIHFLKFDRIYPEITL